MSQKTKALTRLMEKETGVKLDSDHGAFFSLVSSFFSHSESKRKADEISGGGGGRDDNNNNNNDNNNSTTTTKKSKKTATTTTTTSAPPTLLDMYESQTANSELEEQQQDSDENPQDSDENEEKLNEERIRETRADRTSFVVGINKKTARVNTKNFVRSYGTFFVKSLPRRYLSQQQSGFKLPNDLFPKITNDSEKLNKLSRQHKTNDIAETLFKARTLFVKEFELIKSFFTIINRNALIDQTTFVLANSKEKDDVKSSDFNLIKIDNPTTRPYLQDKLRLQNVFEFEIQKTFFLGELIESTNIGYNVILEMITILSGSISDYGRSGDSLIRLADILFTYFIRNRNVMSASLRKDFNIQPQTLSDFIIDEAIRKLANLFKGDDADDVEDNTQIQSSSKQSLYRNASDIDIQNLLVELSNMTEKASDDKKVKGIGNRALNTSYYNVKEPIALRVIAERLALWFVDGIPIQIDLKEIARKTGTEYNDIMRALGISMNRPHVCVVRIAMNFACKVEGALLFPSMWLGYLGRYHLDCMIANQLMIPTVETYWNREYALDVSAIYRRAYIYEKPVVIEGVPLTNETINQLRTSRFKAIALSRYGIYPHQNISLEKFGNPSIDYPTLNTNLKKTDNFHNHYQYSIEISEWISNLPFSKRTIRAHATLQGAITQMSASEKRYLNVILTHKTPALSSLRRYESFMWTAYFRDSMTSLFNSYIPKDTEKQKKIGSALIKLGSYLDGWPERLAFVDDIFSSGNNNNDSTDLREYITTTNVIGSLIEFPRTNRDEMKPLWEEYISLIDKKHERDRNKLITELEKPVAPEWSTIVKLFDRVSMKHSIKEIEALIRGAIIERGMYNVRKLLDTLQLFLFYKREEEFDSFRDGTAEKKKQLEILVKKTIDSRKSSEAFDKDLAELLAFIKENGVSQAQALIINVSGGAPRDIILSSFDSLAAEKKNRLTNLFFDLKGRRDKMLGSEAARERLTSRPQRFIWSTMMAIFADVSKPNERLENLPIEFVCDRFENILFALEKIDRFLFVLRASPSINVNLTHIPIDWMNRLLNADGNSALSIEYQSKTPTQFMTKAQEDKLKEYVSLVKKTPFDRGYPYLKKQVGTSTMWIMDETLTFTRIRQTTVGEDYCHQKDYIVKYAEPMLYARMESELFGLENFRLTTLLESFHREKTNLNNRLESKRNDKERLFGLFSESQMIKDNNAAVSEIIRVIKEKSANNFLKNFKYSYDRIKRMIIEFKKNDNWMEMRQNYDNLVEEFELFKLPCQQLISRFTILIDEKDRDTAFAENLADFSDIIKDSIVLSGRLSEFDKKFGDFVREKELITIIPPLGVVPITVLDPQTGEPLQDVIQNIAYQSSSDNITVNSVKLDSTSSVMIVYQKKSLVDFMKTILQAHQDIERNLIQKLLRVSNQEFNNVIMNPQGPIFGRIQMLLDPNRSSINIINMPTAFIFLGQLVNMLDYWSDSLPDDYVILLYQVIFSSMLKTQQKSLEGYSNELRDALSNESERLLSLLSFDRMIDFISSTRQRFLANWTTLNIALKNIEDDDDEIALRQNPINRMLLFELTKLFSAFRKLIIFHVDKMLSMISQAQSSAGLIQEILNIWNGMVDFLNDLSSRQLITTLTSGDKSISEDQSRLYQTNFELIQQAINNLTSPTTNQNQRNAPSTPLQIANQNPTLVPINLTSSLGISSPKTTSDSEVDDLDNFNINDIGANDLTELLRVTRNSNINNVNDS